MFQSLVFIGISEQAAEYMYSSRGDNPGGKKIWQAIALITLIAIILLDLGVLLYIFLYLGLKNNVQVKSLISSERVHRRNRKNAISIFGHVMGCVTLILGCVLCITVMLGLGRHGAYFVTCLNVFFGSVFQFFQILVTPELRKFVFC